MDHLSCAEFAVKRVEEGFFHFAVTMEQHKLNMLIAADRLSEGPYAPDSYTSTHPSLVRQEDVDD